MIDRGKRICIDDIELSVGREKTSRIVPAHSKRCLSKIVRAEAEKLRVARDLIRHQRGPWNLDHGADEIVELRLFLFGHLFRDATHDLDLKLELARKANQRNHDFRTHLDSFLLHLRGGLENSARLHRGNLREGDAETATAMSKHRIELVQFMNAP